MTRQQRHITCDNHGQPGQKSYSLCHIPDHPVLMGLNQLAKFPLGLKTPHLSALPPPPLLTQLSIQQSAQSKCAHRSTVGVVGQTTVVMRVGVRGQMGEGPLTQPKSKPCQPVQTRRAHNSPPLHSHGLCNALWTAAVHHTTYSDYILCKSANFMPLVSQL